MISRSLRTCMGREQGLRSAVHSIAQTGFAETNVNRYNNVRPDYPKEIIDSLKDRLINDALTKGKVTVLELGAGTGKFTNSFFEYDHDLHTMGSELNYIATEPSPAFRQSLADQNLPVNQVCDATGSSIACCEDGTVDAIIVAQAFHWMATMDTLKEMHRVLSKKGQVFLVWNVVDTNIAWQARLEYDIINKRYNPNVFIPRYITMQWEDCFNTEIAKELFTPVEKYSSTSNHIKVCDEQFIIDRVCSISVVAEGTDAEREKVKEEIHALMTTHADTAHLKDGEYQLQHRTDVATITKQSTNNG